MKIGIAISTYTENKTELERYSIIKTSLNSLENIQKLNKEYELYIIIVVDGEIPEIHNKVLNEFKFNIYRREKNGGVARTKNTSIRLLLENNVDIGFLADDDVEYKPGILEKYVETIKQGKIHHMGFCQMHPLVHPENEWEKMGYVKQKYNNAEVMKHGGGGVGCWLSFTPELIKKIGYFKVMQGKYGYEHINFTLRAIHHKMIPFAIDIINPLEFIDHIGFEPVGYNKFKKSHSITEDYRVSENKKNKNEYKKNLDIYISNIE
jgi:hypothetical protein